MSLHIASRMDLLKPSGIRKVNENLEKINTDVNAQINLNDIQNQSKQNKQILQNENVQSKRSMNTFLHLSNFGIISQNEPQNQIEKPEQLNQFNEKTNDLFSFLQQVNKNKPCLYPKEEDFENEKTMDKKSKSKLNSLKLSQIMEIIQKKLK